MAYLRNCLYLILCVLLFSACGINSPSEYNTGLTYVTNLADEPEREIYAWQGNLDGQYPVLMWYRQNGEVLRGSLFYTEQKNARPITIVGTITGSMYRILEMQHDGNVTGIWNLLPAAATVEGDWFSPQKRTGYNASLMHIDTAVTIPKLTHNSNVSGTYSYSYGADGAYGHLEVVQNEHSVNIEFSNITDAPARNMAMLTATDLHLSENEVNYHADEYGACAIRIRFYNGFAVVSYMDDKRSCGFGHNATVDGVYLKTR